MKNLGLALILSLILSCSNRSDIVVPRFQFHKLNLIAYSWHADNPFTGYSFYTGMNIEIDSSGYCKIFRRDSFMSAEKYFTSPLPFYFDSLISTIEFSKMDSIYKHKENSGSIYCGLSYCLLYEKVAGGNRKSIRFIPGLTPNNFKNFTDSLESFVYSLDSLSVKPFDFSETTNYIATQVEDSSKLPRYVNTITWTKPDSK